MTTTTTLVQIALSTKERMAIAWSVRELADLKDTGLATDDEIISYVQGLVTDAVDILVEDFEEHCRPTPGCGHELDEWFRFGGQPVDEEENE